MLDYLELTNLRTVREISPNINEAVQYKYRPHFKKYILSKNLNIPFLSQIENIFSQIGQYVEDFTINRLVSK